MLIKWLASWKIMFFYLLQMDRWLYVQTYTYKYIYIYNVLYISRHPKHFQLINIENKETTEC